MTKTIKLNPNSVKTISHKEVFLWPFAGVEKIHANLFLDKVWPAILTEDKKLHIFIVAQSAWTYEQFLELADKLPTELRIKLERFYKMDWSKY